MALAMSLSLLLLGASGQPRVEWVGAENCPGAEQELELAVDDYVGEAPLGGNVSASLRLVDAGGSGLWLTLTVESDAGREQHELRALACEQIVEEAGLLLAGVIDPFVYAGGDRRMQRESVPIQRPLSVDRSSPREQLPEPKPEPEPASPVEFGPLSQAPSAIDRSVRERARRSGNEGSLGVAAISFVGLFPQIGGGAQIDGGLERGAFRWQSSLTGYFGGRFRASDADVGANLWALGGSTGVCGVPQSRRIRVPLCAVAGIGGVVARAVGTVEPRGSARPWVHVGGEAGVSVLTHPNLAVGLGLAVQVAVVRPSWEVRSPDVHYAIPPVMGLLRLHMEFSGLGDQNGQP